MAREGSLNGWWLGFVFWTAFLLVLEPGNVAKAMSLGRELSVGREAARIFAAALIGTAGMPAVLYLQRRYEVASSAGRVRKVAWLVFGLVALAGVLNVVSCFVAAWGLQQQALPSVDDVRRQLVGNWALMSFALVGLSFVVRAIGVRSHGATKSQLPARAERVPLRTVIVKTGARSLRVDLGDVDWIEAQGNYVALHVGARAHLHRQTLKSLETELGCGRFIRIHRGALVAVDRIVQIRSEGDGETTVRLSTGMDLTVSKSQRRSLRARWISRADA